MEFLPQVKVVEFWIIHFWRYRTYGHLGVALGSNSLLQLPARYWWPFHLDVPLEVLVNGEDQWVITPIYLIYKWVKNPFANQLLTSWDIQVGGFLITPFDKPALSTWKVCACVCVLVDFAKADGFEKKTLRHAAACSETKKCLRKDHFRTWIPGW